MLGRNLPYKIKSLKPKEFYCRGAIRRPVWGFPAGQQGNGCRAVR